MDKKKIMEIIKIICTAIISIAAVVLLEGCTVALTVAKNNNQSTQKVNQTATADSATVKLPSINK